jgi:hypothetical protein
MLLHITSKRRVARETCGCGIACDSQALRTLQIG